MSEAVGWLSIMLLLTGDVAAQQQMADPSPSCRNFPSGCRMDLCRDDDGDCCVDTRDAPQSCAPGYVAFPAAHDCAEGASAFQCCVEGNQPTKLCSDDDVGGYICGQFGCMKDSHEGSCLPNADGARPAGCQPTSDCSVVVDARSSVITCAGQRCYVPWTDKGADADEVRRTGAECLAASYSDDEDGDGAMDLGWVGPVLVAVAVLVLLDGIRKSVHQVSQREVIVIERFGRYHKTLTAGLSFVVPFIDQPKRYSEKYILTDANGITQVKQKVNVYKISTQEEVLDFPKQRAISRDNAIIELDAVLNFKILHPKIFIYSCVNLPLILSKLLQAQLRNVAGSLELDQMIQDAATLNVLTGLLDMEAQRWGVQIQFVKVQQVKYSHNPQILSLVKDTENKNKEIIIDAKSTKQKAVIESEGQRDKMIKEAEGEANEMLANARGYAQAVRNKASGESRTIREVAKALRSAGESNPTKYLLSVKYLEAVRKISGLPGTALKYVPKNVSDGVSQPGGGAQSVAMGVGLMLGKSFGQ